MSEHFPSDSLTSSEPVAADKKASIVEDFIDIFYAPSEVFRRRERSGFFWPMVVVTVVIGVVMILNTNAMESIMNAEFARSMAQRAKSGGPQLTPEQMQAGMKIGKTMAKVGTFVFMPVTMFVLGLFLWVVGKFMGAKQTLAAAIMVACYSYMPKVLESVLAMVQGLLIDTSTLTGRLQLSIGVGRFLDPDTTNPALLALVGRIDVFTIWVTVLLAIGLAVTGKVSKEKAAVAGVLMWIFGALPLVLPALAQR